MRCELDKRRRKEWEHDLNVDVAAINPFFFLFLRAAKTDQLISSQLGSTSC